MTIILAFIVLGFILYARCLRGTVLLDDAYIFAMKQYLVRGEVKKAWAYPWRKLLFVSYAFNGKFAGADTYPFHVTNVCLHILNSLISILLFRSLGFSDSVSILGGFLYLVHPQCVAAAAYISGRGSLLSGFFVMLALLSVLNGWPILAFPSMALALYSKEDVVPCFLLLAYLSGGWWALAFLIVPFIGYVVQRRQMYSLTTHQTGMSAEHSFSAIVAYLVRLPFWILGWGLNNKPHITTPSARAIVTAIVNLAVLAILAKMVPVVVALIVLGPMLLYMAVPLEDPVMDYRNYLGTLGSVALWLIVLRNTPEWAGIAAVIYLFVCAWPRVGHFRSPITFWVGCMKDGSSESPYVLAQLATSFHMMMDLKSAEHYNKKAIALDPSLNQAWNNLATIYSQQDKIPECVEALERWTVACPRERKSWEKLKAAYIHLKDDLNVSRCDHMLGVL